MCRQTRKKNTTDSENNVGEIKVKVKFDFRKYYNDKIKRLDKRMKLVRTVCLEKLKLPSTLHDESTNLKNLLQSINDPESKSKDLMRHSSLPRKTAQSQTQLLFTNMSIPSITSPPSSLSNNSRAGKVTKTSPPITSPPSSLPNNSRADGLNLFGHKNMGEGVSEGVRENTH